MKRTVVTLTVMLLAATTFAQSEKYQKGMEASIALLDSAKTADDLTATAAKFERIGDAEKTQWLPYYYAALAYLRQGFTDEKANKDELASKADELISKATALEPKNSEIALLQAMSATLHMIVDPMNRWQKYGMMAREATENAKQYDENNPRVYWFQGQSLMNTPSQFGGGKDKAKPLFEKSVELFKTFKPASSLHPNWGEKQAQQGLEQCSK